MISIPGYDQWKLSQPPEPEQDPTARLEDELETAAYPPCDTCGGDLTQADREALSPQEAWDYADRGASLCTPCNNQQPAEQP
jgi:hypothetical protein